MTKKMFLVFFVAAACAGLGAVAAMCGDDKNDTDLGGGDGDTDADNDADADGDSDSDSDADQNPDFQFKATIKVPKDFDAEPARFLTMFYKKLPVAGADEEDLKPAGYGKIVSKPEIDAKHPLEYVTVPNTEAYKKGKLIAAGKYYVVTVLYVKGGGTGIYPIPEVDYIGGTDEAVQIGEGPADVGDIALDLVPPAADADSDADSDSD